MPLNRQRNRSGAAASLMVCGARPRSTSQRTQLLLSDAVASGDFMKKLCFRCLSIGNDVISIVINDRELGMRNRSPEIGILRIHIAFRTPI